MSVVTDGSESKPTVVSVKGDFAEYEARSKEINEVSPRITSEYLGFDPVMFKRAGRVEFKTNPARQDSGEFDAMLFRP